MATRLISSQQDSCSNTGERVKLASMGMANIELTFDMDGNCHEILTNAMKGCGGFTLLVQIGGQLINIITVKFLRDVRGY